MTATQFRSAGMLTYLGQYGDEIQVFNVFRYITFRTGAATMTALLFVFLFGPGIIQALKLRQGKGQPIRADGPQTHLAKAGTPTMGGLMIMSGVLVSTLLWANLASIYVWAVLLVTTGFGLIGLYDDYLKVTKQSHRGFSGKARLAIEAVIAGLAVLLMIVFGDRDLHTSLALPFFKDWAIQLGYFYVIFGAFVIVGAGNAVNFTDGLDGLAIVPVMIAGDFVWADRLRRRQLGLLRVPADQPCAGHGRARRADRRDDRGGARLPLVQCAAGRDLHGRHRVAGARRHARRHRRRHQARDRARHHRRHLRRRGALRHHPGRVVQAHRQARFPDGADPPPFRADGLDRVAGGDPLLDHRRGARDHRPLDAEAEVRMAVTLTHLSGRSIGVFGLARSGLATVRAAVAGGAADVFVWDDKERARDEAQQLGATPLQPQEWPWQTLHCLVLSPGVPLTHPKPHAVVELAKAAGVAIVSDIELLFREAEGRARFVAITGTNGKSTTTALIGHLLNAAGLNASVGGNIGRAALDLEPPEAGTHLRARTVLLPARPHA